MINSTTNELARMKRDAEVDGNPRGHEAMRNNFNLPDNIGKGDDFVPHRPLSRRVVISEVPK